MNTFVSTSSSRKKIRPLLWTGFLFYITFCIYILFLIRYTSVTDQIDLNYVEGYSYNLIPFHTIQSYAAYVFKGGSVSLVALVNLWGNLALFLPMGILVPILFEPLQKARRFLPFLLVLLFAIEGLQLVTKLGCFDVDDIILNYLGGLFGFLFALLLTKNSAS